MRVISGLYKGRLLRTVNNLSVRPATDRVKQTLFDMLTNRIEFEEAKVLDLFAGSGSLGIEALSRGASHATFVEDDDEAADFIEKNLTALGCAPEALVVETDAAAFISRCHDSYDLIFADPPYTYEATANIPGLIFAKTILKPRGYLLIEHTRDMKFVSTALYHVGPEKQFGRTAVTFFRHHHRE